MTVTGGSFLFGYDGISTSGKSTASMASISTVSLDRYEVTVGRFRAFVAAEVAGWRPTAGSGKHSNLNGGKGLNGGTEGGWDTSWSASLATTAAEWATNLACETNATWSGSPGSLEEHPINCVDWYEAYAFCIWDGGFLPSEAEWDYTAAGGGEQRVYPWSLAFPPGSTTLDCSHANYTSCGTGTNKVGSESPLGDGKWGQADLAGNVFEWNLDWYAMSYPTTCDDCANLTKAEYKVIRGGGFEGASACLLNSLRETSVPDGRSSSIGVRCARPPS
jgi:formylglycine-generating enzyme required for sulfatase activity